MAAFSTKKTGVNMTAWEYYVENKTDWKRFETGLKIEHKGKSPIVLFKDPKGKNVLTGTLKNKQSVKLLSNKSFKIGGKIHAYVDVGQKGYLPITQLGKPSKDTTKDENLALSQLNSAIKKRDSGKGVCIVIKNESNKVEHVFQNCTGAKTITGTPKADFSIVTSKGPALFISHKKAGGASAFQQYLSITGKNKDGVNDHPFVQKTLHRFASRINEVVDQRRRFKVRIPFTSSGKLLVLRAIYGPDYGKKFGKEHVHLIGQGNPILTEASPKDRPKGIGTAYELKWSDGHSLSGEISHFKKKGFIPVLWLRYTAGRKIYVSGIEIIGARAFISPEAHAGNSAKEI